MKIVVASPLFPPDVAPPAIYVKELAKRLSKDYRITLVIYGHLPESVQGVSFVSIDKRRPAVMRLPLFFFALLRNVLKADALFVQNGASVELPAGLVALISRRPMILHLGDAASRTRAKNSAFLRIIERFALKCARHVVADTPPPKPEFLPFKPAVRRESIDAYRRAWNTHIGTLKHLFAHVS